MSATEVIYVRVPPDVKRRLEAVVKASETSWPRLTLQGVVMGLIVMGLDRADAERAERERANKGNRVVKGPQLALRPTTSKSKGGKR